MSSIERVEKEDTFLTKLTKFLCGRPFSSLNRTQTLFLVVSFVHICWTLLLNLIIVVRTSIMCSNDYDVYFYAILTSLASLFAMLVGLHAVMIESVPQLLSSIVLHIIIFARQTWGFVYNFVEIFSNSSIIQKNPSCLNLSAAQLVKYEYILLFIGSLIAILFYVLSLYKSFGTITMSIIGIDQHLLKSYRNYQFFISSLLVDSVLVILACVVIIWFGNVGPFNIPSSTYLGAWDYVFISLFGFIPIFLLPFIIIITKREITWLLIIWMIGCLLWPIYLVVYSSIVFVVKNPYSHGDNFGTLRKVTTITLGFVTIVWRFITLIICVVTIFGFKKGLYEKFYPVNQKLENQIYNQLPQSESLEREGFD